MVLISQQLPTLIGGISQQPSLFRRPNQCSDLVNAYNDPVQGVKKRQGSEFISLVNPNPLAYYGAIERDEVEKYIFTISATGIQVWSQNGTEAVVNTPFGIDYLQGSTEFKFLTIADTTFIVNPTKTVRMLNDLTASSTYDGIIFIRAVDYDLKYTVDIDGVGASPATYTTSSSGNLSTSTVADNIASQLNSSSNITAVARGPVIAYRVSGSYDIEAFSSLGDTYITAMPGFVENFGDLPAIAFDGVNLLVNQNPTSSSDDYYVSFDGNGNGVWRESVKPGIKSSLDGSTMPHVLIREANGSFTFRPYDWKQRAVGNEESNPVPSFVGEQISNIFFERNRLGLLSDVNCILSESNGINNFFRTTVSTILDSDPIDLSVSGRQVDKLRMSIGVKDGILLFSEESQFLLNVGDADILSPETASITTVSSYQSNTNVEPKRVGDSIFFVTKRGTKSGVREYFYESGRDFTQSASISEHIPQLLPDGITTISGSSTENIVFFSGSSYSNIFCYQYLYSGNEKVVSSWGKWSFGSSVIKFLTVFNDYLLLIIDRGTYTTLERVALSNAFEEPTLKTEICIDEYAYSQPSEFAYDGTNTSLTIPRLFSTKPVFISTSSFPLDNINAGDRIEPALIDYQPNQTVITFEGDKRQYQFIYGTTYNFVYEFSTPFINLGDGDLEISGRVQVRNVEVSLVNTGFCLFNVIYTAESDSSLARSIDDILDFSQILDMSTLEESLLNEEGEEYLLSRAFPEADLMNSLNLIDYTYRIPIMCRNTEYRLQVRSDGWQPLSISKAQVEMMYHKRSQLR